MAAGTVSWSKTVGEMLVGQAADHRGMNFILVPFTLGSSVSAGGEVPDLSAIVDYVDVVIPLGPATNTGATDSLLVKWKASDGKLQYFQLATNGGDEATGDLDAYTVQLLVIGHDHA